jgi:hypothetical protein
MWIAIYIVAGIDALIWFVRTPLFRAHLRSDKDPGFGNTRAEGRFPGNGGSYYGEATTSYYYGEKTRVDE